MYYLNSVCARNYVEKSKGKLSDGGIKFKGDIMWEHILQKEGFVYSDVANQRSVANPL